MRTVILSIAAVLIATVQAYPQSEYALPEITHAVHATNQIAPRPMQLFLGDSLVSALINPARSALLSQNMVLYSRIYSNQHAVTTAWGETNKRWLLTMQARASVYSDDIERKESAYVLTRKDSLSELFQDSGNGNLFTLKLTNAHSEKQAGHSWSAFFASDMNENNHTRESYSSTTIPEEYYRSETERLDNNKMQGNQWAGGVEYTSFTGNTDFLASLAYQYIPLESKETNNYNRIYNDPYFSSSDSTWHPYKRIYIDKSQAHTEGTAQLVNGRLQYQQGATEENAGKYGTIEFQYGQIAQEFDEDLQDITVRISEADTTENDSLVFIGSGDKSGQLFTVKLEAGTIKQLTMNQVSLILGIIPGIAYHQQSAMNATSYPYDLRENDYTVYNAQLAMPIVGEYRPRPWLTFTGGTELGLYYEYIRQEYRAPEFSSSTTRNYSIDFTGKNEDKTIHTRSTLYAGMRMHLKNSLEIQANFNGYFTAFGRWDVTLGYWFD